ncbi:MAG: HAD family phosphatase [Bacteroidota bacterium]
MQPSALLFDLDGTLVDNMMIHHRAWQKLLLELGLDYSLERVKAEIHGVNMEILERLFGDRFTPEERQQLADQKEAAYRDIFANQMAAVPGALAFIQRAEALGLPIAIATAAPPENAEFVLDGLDLRRSVTALVHSEMVAHGKPNPEVIQKAADAIGVPLSQCLYFEDSVTGAKTGENGGVPTIVITTTHQPEEFEGIKGIISFQPDFTKLWLSDDSELIIKE